MNIVRKHLIILLMTSTLGSLCAQDVQIWLDNSLKPCEKGSATMYMEVKEGIGGYDLMLFNKTDLLKMTGQSLDPKGSAWNGDFIFYHPDGSIESKGLYQDGAKVGIWERYDRTGTPLAERMYAAFDYKTMAYFYVDQMPVFTGGDKKFSDFLKLIWKDIVNEAVILEKDRPLVLSFIVTEKGSIVSPRLTQGVSAEWNAKALNLLTAIPDWIPGQNQGEHVRVSVSFLIEL